MIKLFKTNIVPSFFLLGVLLVLFTLNILMADNLGNMGFHEWYADFFNYIERWPVLNMICTIAFVFVIALVLNSVFNKTSFFQKSTTIPSLMYLLLVSTWETLEFTPLLIIDLVYAVTLLKIVDLDQNKSAIHTGFISGFILGLSFIFSLWFVPIGILVFLAINTFRPFVWREWMVSGLGLILPLVYVVSFHYIYSGVFDLKAIPMSSLSFKSMDLIDGGAYSILAIILAMASLGIFRNYNMVTIVQRKQLIVLLFFLVLTMAIAIIIFSLTSGWLFLFNVPVSILLSVYVVRLKRERLMNILVMVLLFINLLRIFI